MNCDGSSTTGVLARILGDGSLEGIGAVLCETTDKGRARTSCPLPALSCRGTSSPPWSSIRLSPSSHCVRPARERFAVSIDSPVFPPVFPGPRCMAGVRVVFWGARRGRRRRWSSSRPGVARSCPKPIPHRDQHASCISRTHTPTMHRLSTMDCTYRPFLSLRRAIVVLGRSGACGFPLGRALHCRYFWDRVVYPSKLQKVLMRVRIVAAVQ